MDINLTACLAECGLSDKQIEALEEEGYITLQDFALNSYNNILELVKRVQVLPINHGGTRFGQVHIIKLKDFLYWLKDRQRRGLLLELDNVEFGQEELQGAVVAFCIENDEKDSKMVMPKIPKKFQLYSLCSWNTFNRELKNYLAGIKGISGVPLTYMIRKDAADGAPLPYLLTKTSV